MSLAKVLRDRVRSDASISDAARGSGVPQPTLQEFAVGRPDGSFTDLRLSSAQKLIDYYGIEKLTDVSKTTRSRSRRMQLALELKISECPDSAEKFRDRLIAAIIDQFPEQTIDDLVCTPADAQKYCEYVRQGVGAEFLADIVILKTLLNIRKSKNCPVGLKRKRSRKVLQAELKSCGCDLVDFHFREVVVDCLADMYKNQTVDELLCHPREARMLCNYVRRQASCSTLPDQLILSTLMNVRKAGCASS